MRQSYFLMLVVSIMQQAYADESIAKLKPLKFSAVDDSDKVTVLKENFESAKNLGDLLSHTSGIQNSAFGPNAGAPVIRSLTGNRVGVYENGQLINGMNAISGDINIPFDPLFTEKIIINKNSDSIRYGGNALGGSVIIESGIISKEMEEKQHDLDIVYRKGFNDFNSKGFKFNFNNQSNWSSNIRYSEQEISFYKIPEMSKAKACENEIFIGDKGVNTSLSDVCQKDSRIQSNYNTSSQPYIDQFMTENPDWADGQFSFYTDNPSSVWSGKTYINPPNPKYSQNTPKFTDEKISSDVTPNYYKKLGNSYAKNENFGSGITYFFDKGYIGLSADNKNSEYGVPGFSMQNQSFQKNYSYIPVGVKINQNQFNLDTLWRQPFSVIEVIQFKASQLLNTSGEYLGVKQANEYKFNDYSSEILFKHKKFNNLTGETGIQIKQKDVVGSGPDRYLPNLNNDAKAFFIKENISFQYLNVEAGYRIEKIEYKVKDQNFKLSRNAKNSTLKDQSFNLQNYFLGANLKFNDYLITKFKYSQSKRAPEINELYSSNAHYSVMTQEEGNQNLNTEKLKGLELSTLLDWGNNELQVVLYQMDFDNYIYLTHSGAQMQNRLPLKYWTQTDTEIKGYEIDFNHKFEIDKYGSLELGFFADFVKNKAKSPSEHRLFNDGIYLPNMPTNRYSAYLDWEKDSWKARIISVYYDKPKYLGKNVTEELPLPSYNLLEMNISRNINLPKAKFNIFLHGSNLLNEDARPQNSSLKYIAPLPGRAFQFGITMSL